MPSKPPPAGDTTLVATGAATPATTVTHATTIREITRACEVERPLVPGDPRWLDLSPARGDRATRKLLRRFEDKPAGEWLHMLFASHRGAGKSTELMLLASRLPPRYHCLYFVANVQMDPNVIEVEDLLLVLAQGIEHHMRAIHRPLPADKLERVTNWFSTIIRSTEWARDASVALNAEARVGVEAKAEAGAPVGAGTSLFAKLFAGVSALFRVESKHREEVKNELKKYPGTLIDSVNLLLDAAADQLGDRELLIMIDNLDRYPPAVVDSLLVRNGDRLRQLHCNLILTPPIGLLYRPHSEQIDTYFPCEVMNTVRLRRKDQPYDAFDDDGHKLGDEHKLGHGHKLLLEVLERRIDLALLMPDQRAQDRLLVGSGGAIRELLALVVDAAMYAEGEALTLTDVEYAVGRKKQRLRDLINANGWWPTLAKIARDKQIVSDPACLDVLYHRLVLKYNGDGWYDVLPILTELPEFKHACKQLPAGP